MRVAVIGAGIAGLVAARDLRGAGHEVVVLEKSRGVGGRMAARRVEGTVVDHGLPLLDVPHDGILAEFVVDLATDDVIEVEAPGDPSPGCIIDGAPRLAWPQGMTRLPKALAEGLEVVTDVRVAGIRQDGDLLEVAQDQGNSLGGFDWVAITAPGAQAADLLDASPRGAVRASDMRAVAYDTAVMLLAGVAVDAPEWFAHRPLTGPIAYVTNEMAKG
ncbi:MAG: FAD-dependent oxidoreductase, partial [Miltoncostaeaceae bacterium]